MPMLSVEEQFVALGLNNMLTTVQF